MAASEPVFQTDAEADAYNRGFSDGYGEAEEYFSKDYDKQYEKGFDDGYALKEVELDTSGFVRFLASKLGITSAYHKEVLTNALAGNPGARYHITKLLGETDA